MGSGSVQFVASLNELLVRSVLVEANSSFAFRIVVDRILFLLIGAFDLRRDDGLWQGAIRRQELRLVDDDGRHVM